MVYCAFIESNTICPRSASSSVILMVEVKATHHATLRFTFKVPEGFRCRIVLCHDVSTERNAEANETHLETSKRFHWEMVTEDPIRSSSWYLPLYASLIERGAQIAVPVRRRYPSGLLEGAKVRLLWQTDIDHPSSIAGYSTQCHRIVTYGTLLVVLRTAWNNVRYAHRGTSTSTLPPSASVPRGPRPTVWVLIKF